MKYKLLQILNIIAFISVIILNYFAATGVIGGVTPGEVSDSYHNLFTPSGFTFSIWSVIYLYLLIFIIYQSKSLFKQETAPDFIHKISGYFAVSSLINILWIFAWHNYMIGLALALLIVLLFTLLVLYTRLNIGLSNAGTKEKYLVHAPFSIYLSWVSLAVIANFAIYLTSIEWGGFGMSDPGWARFMIIAAGFIAVVISTLRDDVFYALVVCWGVFGIIAKWFETEQPVLQALSVTGWVVIGTLIIISVFKIVRNKGLYS